MSESYSVRTMCFYLTMHSAVPNAGYFSRKPKTYQHYLSSLFSPYHVLRDFSLVRDQKASDYKERKEEGEKRRA